jgi:chorismate synthase
MGLRLLTAGESHGPCLISILDGLPSGLAISPEDIDVDLARRQDGYGAGPRMKLEHDRVQILAGVMEGRTTGAPVALMIENADHKNWKGRKISAMTIPRPGHADLAGAIKYGMNDLRPVLERASARETASRVAAGAVCRLLLAAFGIKVGGYVSAIGNVSASIAGMSIETCVDSALTDPVHCPDPGASRKMQSAIHQAMLDKDTLGGIIEVTATGLSHGLGSYTQWDKRLDARLGGVILSVPAIKGVEFGQAFENSTLVGTKVQDPILLENKRLVRPSNHDGGLEGGVTTGQPLIIRAAMKPIPTTLTPQRSVDLVSGEEVDTRYERSDFCPVPRAVVILEAMVAFVLADALMEKLGGDTLDEMQQRFANLRKVSLEDLHMDGHEHIFWQE